MSRVIHSHNGGSGNTYCLRNELGHDQVVFKLSLTVVPNRCQVKMIVDVFLRRPPTVSGSLSMTTVVAAGVGSVVVLLFFAVTCVFVQRHRKDINGGGDDGGGVGGGGGNSRCVLCYPNFYVESQFVARHFNVTTFTVYI